MHALIVEAEAEAEIGAALEWYEAQQAGLGEGLMGEVEGVISALRERRARGVQRCDEIWRCAACSCVDSRMR